MLKKSRQKIVRELDLKKFITGQRLQTMALMGILSGRQSFFVDKMSQMIIRESSNSEREADEQELSDWGRDNMGYAKQLAFSNNKVD